MEGVARLPVDGGKLSLMRERGVQRPKRSYHAKRRLGYGFGEVPSGRGYGADKGERACPLRPAEDRSPSASLVKLSQPVHEIGGITFLSRYLLEPRSHFTKRFRPSREAVGEHRYPQSHVAEILGDRDPKV